MIVVAGDVLRTVPSTGQSQFCFVFGVYCRGLLIGYSYKQPVDGSICICDKFTEYQPSVFVLNGTQTSCNRRFE